MLPLSESSQYLTALGFARQVAVNVVEPVQAGLFTSRDGLTADLCDDSSAIGVTFMCPQTSEEATVQEIPVISHIQEVFGYPTLEVGHLDMFAHVLYRLKGIGKIRVTADKHCHIIEVVPGKI